MTETLKKADALVAQQQVDQAVPIYVDVLIHLPAGPRAAETMSKLADCYVRLGQYEKVLATVTALEKQYPQSPYTGANCARKCLASLELNDTRGYTLAFQELLDKAALPKYVWPLIEREYTLKQAALEPGASLPCARFSKFAELPMTYGVHDKLFWFRHVQMTRSDDFLKEGLAAIEPADAMTSATDLVVPVMVAVRLYDPLMKQGKKTETLAMNRRMQQAILRLRNPFAWKDADVLAFTDALCKYDPQAYCNWVGARTDILKIPMASAELENELTVYYRFYDQMIGEGYPEITVRVHEVIQKLLASANTAYQAQNEQTVFLSRLVYIQSFYGKARDTGRFADMKRVHDYAQTLYPKVNRPDLLEADNREFTRVTNALPRWLYFRQFCVAMAFGDTERAKGWRDALVCTGNDPYAQRAAELLPSGEK
jgi:hypothetical protein